MLLVEHVVDNAAVNCRRVSSELVKIWWFIFVILFYLILFTNQNDDFITFGEYQPLPRLYPYACLEKTEMWLGTVFRLTRYEAIWLSFTSLTIPDTKNCLKFFRFRSTQQTHQTEFWMDFDQNWLGN